MSEIFYTEKDACPNNATPDRTPPSRSRLYSQTTVHVSDMNFALLASLPWHKYPEHHRSISFSPTATLYFQLLIFVFIKITQSDHVFHFSTHDAPPAIILRFKSRIPIHTFRFGVFRKKQCRPLFFHRKFVSPWRKVLRFQFFIHLL